MLYEDFDGNLPKVRSTIEKFAGAGDNINAAQMRLFDMIMDYLQTPGNNWRELVLHVINDVDKEVARTFLINFFVNSVTIGGYRSVVSTRPRIATALGPFLWIPQQRAICIVLGAGQPTIPTKSKSR